MSRNTHLASALAFSMALFTSSAAAYEEKEKEPFTGTASAGLCKLNISSGTSVPDFETCGTYNLYGGYRFTSWLHAEVGFQDYSNASTAIEKDLAGSYETEFTATTTFAGLGIHFPVHRTLIPYVRGGVLHYRSKLTVHEYFDDIYPEGSQTARDNGTGYYWATGLTLQSAQELRFILEFQQQVLQNIFEDSSRPLEARYNSIMLGFGF